MAFRVIVPARLGSTRLPRKALVEIGGVPMIVRVARRAAQSGAASVVVATDSSEIVSACAGFGVAAILTGAHHTSGSDRLAEASIALGIAATDIVVNVQGDEPMIEPDLIDACAAILERRGDCVMSTAAHAIGSTADFNDPNIVKVVLDASGRALYFSRAPIPWPRDDVAPHGGEPSPAVVALRHVGIYAYRAGFLRRFPAMARSPLEEIERLEQLRVLWHGEHIAVHVSDRDAGIGIDTPADLEKARALFIATNGAGFA